MLLAVAIVSLSAGIGPASAEQQQWGAAYLDWSGALLSKDSTVSQVIQPLEVSPATYWEAGWGWGYGGIQTGARLQDGSIKGNAIFSIWDSLEAIAGKGAHCLVFGGEGVGHSCRIAIDLTAGHRYEFKVGVDVARGSQWWTASVTDLITGTNYPLGSIKHKDSMADSKMWNNFIEYFGEAVPCDAVGPATAKFYTPTSTNSTVEFFSPRFSRPANPDRKSVV